ncbi:MAG TPA: hybrid sensor histidine kinase/response regulator [Myxococcales bacterium]|nr:hybrid sensor histidine kinase/response regulator [Myxococcales bacterium]
MKVSPAEENEPVASVLMVDDRPENLLALEGVLKPLGARLVRARSGEEALMHLLRETFAVILLDVQMPKLDGLQTAELIKQREQTRHIPIIFITALSREAAWIFKGYEQGAVDYLLKPIDPEILRAKVRVFCDLYVRGERIRRQAVENEVKDEFLASVVHELRTPLAAAKAQTQLALHQLSENGDDANATRALRVISRQIDRLVRLVGDLLDVNRLEGNQLEMNPTEFDVSALVEEVRSRMQTLGDRHPIKMSVAEGIHYYGDRDRIDQALTNLLSNSVRYSPDGGEIQLAVEETPEGLHFTIRDHGLGIPKDQQEHIFEKFARAHGAAYGGLGLGLAITKGIVDQHGGTIWVESEGVRGKGSTFHLRLPQHRGDRPTPRQGQTQQQEAKP